MIAVINSTKIIKTPIFTIGNIEHSPTIKYGSLDFVLQKSNKQVSKIIETMCSVIQNKHSYIIVDVKVHDLKEKELPCLDNWHIDCVGRHDEPQKEEVHHLVLFGDCSLTSFIDGPIEIDVPNDKVINWNKLLVDPPTFQIESNTIYTYGRNLHKGMPATKNGRRLLIRITETDKINPRNIIK